MTPRPGWWPPCGASWRICAWATGRAARPWRAEDPQALRALEIRVKAVYALRHEIDFPGIASREEELDAEALESNPLIRCFLPQGAELPRRRPPPGKPCGAWRGIPFAREDGELLLSATGDPREEEAWPPWGKTC